MKSIEFSEDQLHNLKDIGAALFSDPTDPRSMSYVRELKRPKIHWFRIILCLLLPPAALIAFGFLLHHWGLSTLLCVLIPLVLLLLYGAFMLKPAAICAVKIYQRYAPDYIRNKCRFEPSCSEYMILSLQKYGFIKGLRKGRNRLKRCNVKDGGYDYP